MGMYLQEYPAPMSRVFDNSEPKEYNMVISIEQSA